MSSYANETMIFEGKEDGSMANGSDLWSTRPQDHQGVLSRLVSGDLPESDLRVWSMDEDDEDEEDEDLFEDLEDFNI